MAKLADLQQLQSEIAALEARLAQLQDPVASPVLEGLHSTGEILGEIQRVTGQERARLEEVQTLELALPALKQRYVIMQKECEKIKKELDKALIGWEKLSLDVKSSLEAVLTKIDDLKSEGLRVQRLYNSAYGNDGSTPIFTDHWPHRYDYPFVYVRQGDTTTVVLSTEGQRSQWEQFKSR